LHQWVFPSSARPADTHPPGPAAAAPVNPYLLTGRLTAELVVHKGESSSSTYRFAIRTKQSALTTGLAVGVVVLALFAVAYIESYIRTLRRGRSRVSGSFGLTLSAAAVGVAAVGAVWVPMGRGRSRVSGSFGLTLSAAAAGVAATVGWLRVGTKYRYRRARRRSSH
jgi:hypothetical protein